MADTNLNPSSGIKNPNVSNVFDLHKIKSLLVKYWYWLVISLSVSVGITYLVLRYEVPVYRAATTILLKDAGENSLSRMELTEGFGLSPEMKSIENQTFIIRSQKMVKRAIERLDFGISYAIEGNMRATELYKTAPFEVLMDSTHAQLTGADFRIVPIDDIHYQLNIQDATGALYRYDQQTYQGGVDPYSFSGKFRYGDAVTTDYFSFIIHRHSKFNFGSEVTYSFRFNTIGALVGEYRGALAVTPYSEGSSIVIIYLTGRQTDKMTAFLNTLTQVIMEYNLDKKNEIASRSLSFINVQLKNVADSLLRVQTQLASFRKEHPFAGGSGGTQSSSSEYFGVEKELRLLMLRKEYLVYLSNNLNDRSALEDYFVLAGGADQSADPMAGQLVTQLMGFADEKALLGGEDLGSNPYIRTLDQKITLARQNLQILLGQAINRIDTRIHESKIIIGELENRIAAMPDVEKEFVDIERRYKLNDAIYTFLLQKQSENQIAKASNTSDNEVLEEPSVVALVSPDQRRHYTRGMMIGLLIPIVIIVLKEFLNTRVRSVDELKALNLNVPVVGAIPINPEPIHDVIYKRPSSLCSESFRRLRVKLQFLLSGKDKKVIIISSSNKGEGKSFCSFNLASIFAISGKKTVLLGFDLRKPKLDSLLQTGVSAGLSNYLAEQAEIDDIITPLKYPNLSFIGAGVVPPNPAELISQPRTAQLFEHLRANFDVIIVDTAPIGIVADTRILVDYADAFVFITRAGITEKEHLRQTIDNLLSENMQSIGLVLNGLDAKDRSYGYYGSSYLNVGE